MVEATDRLHPVSPPRAQPGKIDAPVRGWLGPSYSFLSAAACGAVRQLSLSPDLHSRAAGSKVHAPGFSISPSARPSVRSQAAIAAAWIAGSFVAGIAAPGALSVCASQTKPAAEWDW